MWEIIDGRVSQQDGKMERWKEGKKEEIKKGRNGRKEKRRSAKEGKCNGGGALGGSGGDWETGSVRVWVAR